MQPLPTGVVKLAAVRDESSRTFIRKFSETTKDDIAKQLKALAAHAAKGLAREKVPASDMEFGYQVDVRYHGQGLRLSTSSPCWLAS